MNRWLIVAVAAALCVSCSRQDDVAAASGESGPGGPAAAAGQPYPARNLLRVEPAVVVDASGFEQPIGAATLFIPQGWRAQGGVLWGQEFMCTNGYGIQWQAVSPDGFSSIAILPSERWESNTYGAPASTPGCPMAPYTTVRQYLEALAQRLRPGSRVLDFRVRQDLQAQFAQLSSSTPMPAGEMRTSVDAGEVLIAFADRGRDMRGTIAAVAVFTLTRANYGMGPMDALNAYTFPAYAVTAPNGQLDMRFFEAVRRSIKLNPQWERRIGNHNAAIGRVAIEESRKRANIIARSNEEISRIRQETWNSYQESSDRRAREFGEAIRGVETYNDDNAPGGTVELSHLYDHAWRLNDGSYVLTNDVNFDPWRDLQVEGRRLEPTR
jgi:hypothetical protein